MSQPVDTAEFLGRLLRGEVSTPEMLTFAQSAHVNIQRRRAAAVRRAHRIDKELHNLKREMIDHCRNPHGQTRHAELIRFDLTVRLAERDRLSRAVPTLDDDLLDQLADDYDAADAREAAAQASGPMSEEADRAPVHIHLPNEADPAAAVEAIKAALGGKESE